jgi:F420-dependent oxidoreductase-like protein
MRIGLAFGDARKQRDLAGITGEIQSASGIDTAWVTQGPNLDALVTLAIAGARSTVELGTAVVPFPQRHPLVLASQALTVQAATGNRLTLGIGAGIAAMVGPMFGLPTDRPARRLREYLEVLRPLLRGEAVDHHGETLTAVGAVAIEGAAAPPVLVAALGPAMLKVTGELADGTITWMTGPRTLAEHVVPSITKASQGRPAPRIVAGLHICLTTDTDSARSQYATDFALSGQVPEYRAVLDREGVSGPADVLLAGDEDMLAKRIDQLRDTGITDLMLAPIGSTAEQARTIEFLSTIGG